MSSSNSRWPARWQLRAVLTPASPVMGTHEMDIARMGRDPKTSVPNKFNQTHELKNLLNTDGAAMVSSAASIPRSPTWR